MKRETQKDPCLLLDVFLTLRGFEEAQLLLLDVSFLMPREFIMPKTFTL